MAKKLWYAVLSDSYTDWDDGSFNYKEACEKVELEKARLAKIGKCEEVYIAVIDADYDENGRATREPICIDEIHYFIRKGTEQW